MSLAKAHIVKAIAEQNGFPKSRLPPLHFTSTTYPEPISAMITVEQEHCTDNT